MASPGWNCRNRHDGHCDCSAYPDSMARLPINSRVWQDASLGSCCFGRGQFATCTPGDRLRTDRPTSRKLRKDLARGRTEETRWRAVEANPPLLGRKLEISRGSTAAP